jgi:thiol-disulfide isomerase/thioredoxin
MNRMMLLEKYFAICKERKDSNNMLFCLLRMRTLHGKMGTVLHKIYCDLADMNDVDVVNESKEEYNDYYFTVSMYETIIDSCKNMIKENEQALQTVYDENKLHEVYENKLVDINHKSDNKQDKINSEHKLSSQIKPHVINFYASWCPACIQFEPTWDKIMEMAKNSDIVASKVECGNNEDIQKKYSITGFPTIKLFYMSDSNKIIKDFDKPRTIDNLTKWISDETGINIQKI